MNSNAIANESEVETKGYIKILSSCQNEIIVLTDSQDYILAWESTLNLKIPKLSSTVLWKIARKALRHGISTITIIIKPYQPYSKTLEFIFKTLGFTVNFVYY